MKRLIGPLIVIVGVLVAGIVAYRNYSEKMVLSEKAQAALTLKNRYLERVGWIRTNPDDKQYKEEVSTFLRNYFKDVNEFQNRFGGSKEHDEYLTELDQRTAKKADSQEKEKRAAWETVKKTMDVLKNDYSPMQTFTDKGLRLDLMTAEVSGGRIKMPFVLWGAQREVRDDGKQKKVVVSASFRSTWKLFDDKGKLLGEVNVEGAEGTVDNPERYIDLFPPQMYIGTFPMDLLPAEASKLEITWSVTSRAQSGGEALANYVWKMDTPAEWKLKAGEKWEGAQESVRPEDEIDPAAAAKKQAKR